MQEFVKILNSFILLLELKPQITFDELGEDIDKWKQLINEVKQGRKIFDNIKNKNKKTFGSFIVDYSSLQKKVNNKYDIWYDELLDQFALKTNEGLKKFSQILNDAISFLYRIDSSDIIEFFFKISQTKKS